MKLMFCLFTVSLTILLICSLAAGQFGQLVQENGIGPLISELSPTISPLGNNSTDVSLNNERFNKKIS